MASRNGSVQRTEERHVYHHQRMQVSGSALRMVDWVYGKEGALYQHAW